MRIVVGNVLSIALGLLLYDELRRGYKAVWRWWALRKEVERRWRLLRDDVKAGRRD